MVIKLEDNAHEKIYADLLSCLKNIDLIKVANEKNLQVKDEKILLPSFARLYQISHHGVSAIDKKPVTFLQKLAVVSYVLSDGKGYAAYEFVPFSELGGYNIGREQHAIKAIKKRILNKFGNNYRLFEKASWKIGGLKKKESQDKHVWLYYAFPNVPILASFYEADEEFPADVQVLFDIRSLDFLGLKCLGFLPDYFVTSLIEVD